MEKAEGEIGLGRHLASRLFPVALGIGLLICVGFPAIYYVLQSTALRNTARIYAEDLSKELGGLILEAPDLWKYRSEKYSRLLHDFLPYKSVTSIRVLDEAGRPIPGLDYATATDGAWWNRYPPRGLAPVVFNNRRLGTVQVKVSQIAVLRATLLLFFIFATMGVCLAIVIYRFPVKVATGLEGEIKALIETVQRSNRELMSLLSASRIVVSSLKLDEVLQTIVREAAGISGAHAVRLFLLDEDEQVLRWHVGVGLPPEVERDLAIPVGESFSGQVVATGQPLAVPDCRGDPRLRYPQHVSEYSLISYLGLPVKLGERVFGVLVLNTSAPRVYTKEEISYFSAFADEAAIAIENARLYEERYMAAVELEAKVEDRTRELAVANRQMEEANRQLQAASRHKSEFLANMSHEIRTPLNSIIGFAELVGEQRVGPLNEKQARYLGHIRNSGKHLLQLISDILDLSKVEAGKFVLQPEVLPAAASLEDILVLARGLANKKNQVVAAEIEPDLPPLRTDPVRFKQILFNLLSNAVKFTPDQGRITLVARRAARDGNLLELRVTDTGIGLRAEDLPRLFQEFVQLETTRAQSDEGTGLGLALTKRLVDLHGGRIWAESEGEGHGATFIVLLPFRGPGVSPEAQGRTRARTGGGEGGDN